MREYKSKLPFHLFYGWRRNASAVFLESEMLLNYDESPDLPAMPPNPEWRKWRQGLGERLIDLWLSNRGSAQLTIDATVYGDRRIVFHVADAICTDEFEGVDGARKAVAAALESLTLIAGIMQDDGLLAFPDPECVSARIRMHFSSHRSCAPRFRTHAEMPVVPFRGRTALRPAWWVNSECMVKGPFLKPEDDAPLADPPIDGTVFAATRKFASEWNALQSKPDASTRASVDRLFGRAGISPSSTFIADRPEPFAAMAPARELADTNNKLRALLLSDCARYANAASTLSAETLEAIRRGALDSPIRPDALAERIPGFIAANWRALWGPWEMDVLTPYAFIHEHDLLDLGDTIRDWIALHRGSLCAWFNGASAAILSAPELMLLDDEGRFHNGDGPALRFRGGEPEYFWHGIRVRRNLIDRQISLDDIENENNSEVRRAMLEIYGFERFIAAAQCQLVQEDAYGALYRRRFRTGEGLAIVRVVNSTPEPDGSFKHYYLRVPPDTQTAHAGVAWSFGMTPAEYNPSRQT